MIKIAYLYCFSLWGYEFAFSKAGEAFRNVVNGILSYPVPYGIAYTLENIPNFRFGPCVIKEPDFKAIAVNFPVIIGNYRCIIGVLIPEADEAAFEKLRQSFSSIAGQTKDMPAHLFNTYDLNTNPNGFRAAWTNLKNETLKFDFGVPVPHRREWRSIGIDPQIQSPEQILK